MTPGDGSASDDAPDLARYADRTRVTVASGPLAGPVLSRVVAVGAARAELSSERRDAALLLADVIAAHAPALVPEGRIELTSSSSSGTLELRLGPLRPGGAAKLLDESADPALGALIARLASATSIAPNGSGDVLIIEISA